MIDVTGAYTHALIDRPLQVEYPERYGRRGPTVMKLKKSHYGAHQSGCLREQYRNAKVLALGCKLNPKDVSILMCNKDSIDSIVLCYFDDLLFC
jgi:hypothetical protein